tara:strand:+ start:274 stop:1830 length:1557 start_codon:yes stop_codon:yes gene_type:complete
MELDKVNIFDYQAPSPKDILAAGPGAIAAPLSPAEVLEMQKSQFSSDPVIKKLQKVGRGIGSLFAVETPVDYALSGLGAVKPVVAAGKGIAAVAKEADPKDLVFVHNTSEEAIKSFDNMDGIPSPSIAVMKGDQPFTGFGNIQLIGKPEKFDPLVDPRNKIYSADAYTPRAPKKLRLAKPGAADKYLEKYGDEKLAGTLRSLENKDIGSSVIDKSEIIELTFDSQIAPEYLKRAYLKDTGQDKVTSSRKFQQWLNKEKDKYLSQDGVFIAGRIDKDTGFAIDPFDTTVKPYTLDNVVENMVQDTQRGGEGGLGMFGSNRLRALMSERFESLADIKNRKEMLAKDDEVFDLFDDIQQILEDVDPELSGNTGDIINNIGEGLKMGDDTIESIVENALDFYADGRSGAKSLEKAASEIATSLRLNAMRPVEYFEAKPIRSVGFDEFAGAIVPEATSQEVIDILEKRGLKVIKQKFDDIDKDYGKGKIRQQFKDQFFSAAPIAAAASATAMIDSQDQGIGSL